MKKLKAAHISKQIKFHFVIPTTFSYLWECQKNANEEVNPTHFEDGKV